MGYKALDLDGKVAVVVGGSSGIGKTIAVGLAQGGADAVASKKTYRTREGVGGRDRSSRPEIFASDL